MVEQYTQKLEGVQEHLEEGVEGSYDSSMKPVNYSLEPVEEIALYELIRTDNKVLNKVMMALSSLCCEIRILQKEVRRSLFTRMIRPTFSSVAPLLGEGSLLPSHCDVRTGGGGGQVYGG